jgi:excisionase family DNA binding protein
MVAVRTDTLYSESRVIKMPKQSYLPAATVHVPPARRAELRRAVEQGVSFELRSSSGQPIATPELAQLLRLALDGLASGSDVVLLTSETELSPTEAGKLLGVSRQYVDRLLDLGDLPGRQLPGSRHRRIRAADVVAFQQQRAQRRGRIADAVNDLIDAGADY